jgi:Uma2 family endonuclease
MVEHEREWNLRAVPDLHLRVSPTRYRVPDVTVLDRPVEPDYQTRPPLIVIEILSAEDRMRDLIESIEDYLDFGVENIWIFDPALKRAWVATRGQLTEVCGRLKVAGTGIYLWVPEMFKSEDKGEPNAGPA